MLKPKCGHCGNDGSQGALFVTVDARWNYAEQRWDLEPREDDGGCEIDCLNCDERTSDPPEDSAFPYGPLPAEALEAWRALTDG